MSLKEKKEEELASQQICSEEIDSGKQWQGSEEIRQQNYSKAARSRGDTTERQWVFYYGFWSLCNFVRIF